MREQERLQRRIEELEEANRLIDSANRKLTEENLSLRERLNQKELELKLLLERFFGRKSERFIENPDQLRLELGDTDQVEDAIEGIRMAKAERDESSPRPKRGREPRREKFPPHLPREVVVVDLPEPEKAGLTCIGYDAVETMVFSPGTLKVREKRYMKYVDSKDSSVGVRQPEREVGLVEGNRYDTSVAAHIVAAKYGYHQPVYRQQDIFAAAGWTPSRSTLLNILTEAAALIRPLTAFFADAVRRDSVIGTDDTSVTLLLPNNIPQVDADDPKSRRVHEVFAEARGQGKVSVNAKMWAYRGVHVPLNVFDFTVSRHRDGPDLFLIDHGYAGTLLGDCYGANVGITMRSSGSIAHAACSAHARRKLLEARDNHGEHADQLLAMFRKLYDVEDRARALDDSARLALRRSEAAPIWGSMRKHLDAGMSNVLPKEAMAKAVGYLDNQWRALTRHLSDGAIPIDNNDVEQLMKQVALGRKNWLFIGSVQAGYRTADLMTLVSSAIRNDLDVWAYVKGVLDALLAGGTDHHSLRPDVWVMAHPEHKREYRTRERRDRTERQQHRRELRRRTKGTR